LIIKTWRSFRSQEKKVKSLISCILCHDSLSVWSKPPRPSFSIHFPPARSSNNSLCCRVAHHFLQTLFHATKKEAIYRGGQNAVFATHVRNVAAECSAGSRESERPASKRAKQSSIKLVARQRADANVGSDAEDSADNSVDGDFHDEEGVMVVNGEVTTAEERQTARQFSMMSMFLTGEPSTPAAMTPTARNSPDTPGAQGQMGSDSSHSSLDPVSSVSDSDSLDEIFGKKKTTKATAVLSLAARTGFSAKTTATKATGVRAMMKTPVLAASVLEGVVAADVALMTTKAAAVAATAGVALVVAAVGVALVAATAGMALTRTKAAWAVGTKQKTKATPRRRETNAGFLYRSIPRDSDNGKAGDHGCCGGRGRI
jgi:hypothetical protein